MCARNHKGRHNPHFHLYDRRAIDRLRRDPCKSIGPIISSEANRSPTVVSDSNCCSERPGTRQAPTSATTMPTWLRRDRCQGQTARSRASWGTSFFQPHKPRYSRPEARPAPVLRRAVLAEPHHQRQRADTAGDPGLSRGAVAIMTTLAPGALGVPMGRPRFTILHNLFQDVRASLARVPCAPPPVGCPCTFGRVHGAPRSSRCSLV